MVTNVGRMSCEVSYVGWWNRPEWSQVGVNLVEVVDVMNIAFASEFVPLSASSVREAALL